jgi:2-deoxy-D-gluconate 3-dehydrogenase
LRADEKRSAEILGRIPAGRWGTPEDLQGTLVFLASAASDYVTGYTIAVDGGWLAR